MTDEITITVTEGRMRIATTGDTYKTLGILEAAKYGLLRQAESVKQID